MSPELRLADVLALPTEELEDAIHAFPVRIAHLLMEAELTPVGVDALRRRLSECARNRLAEIVWRSGVPELSVVDGGRRPNLEAARHG